MAKNNKEIKIHFDKYEKLLGDEKNSEKRIIILDEIKKNHTDTRLKSVKVEHPTIKMDMELLVESKIDDKNEITFIGLGALDNFSLNLDANETESQKIQLETLPVFLQSNYTIGVNYKHYKANGYSTVVLSRNYLKNTTKKYKEK